MYRSRVRLSLSQAEASALLSAYGATAAGEVEETIGGGQRRVSAFFRAYDKLKNAYWAACDQDVAKGRPPRDPD